MVLRSQPIREAKDALFAYDRFDARGAIEHLVNEEAKRAWNLESPLEKSESAVYLHAHMVFLTMAVSAAFRAQETADGEAQARGEDTGIARYPRELERANRGKVIIRLGNYYAVLWNWELAVLLGVELNWHPGETAEKILACYRVPRKGVPPWRTRG